MFSLGGALEVLKSGIPSDDQVSRFLVLSSCQYLKCIRYSQNFLKVKTRLWAAGFFGEGPVLCCEVKSRIPGTRDGALFEF